MNKENETTLKDYLLSGGVQGKSFYYGGSTTTETIEPVIYRIKDIEKEQRPNLFLKVVRMDKNAKGREESLSLFNHIDDIEFIADTG